MPSEPVLVAMNGVRDVGVARQAVQLPQLVHQIEVELLERDQQRVERRRVMALRREVDVATRARRCWASFSSSVHSQVIRSVELKLDPMCPDPARMIM